MKNENIGTNITNETIYSTNVHEEENVSSEVLTDNQIDATMSASDIQSGEAELVLMQPLDETANVATASVECCDDCCEDKASTAEMDNAVHLTLNEWRNDTITSSISERWYKFSANEADTYTIYTSGSTDTIGRLYDENGDRVTLNDDRAGSLNFRIVYPLDANSTYYVKVTTSQAQTGEFSIRVVKRVLPALSKYNLTLNVGEEDSIQITTSSNSTTDIYVKYSSSDPDSVSVNSDTGDVTAVGTGISVITATDIIHNDVIGECEVWVKGKTPVFLLHGRGDDTSSVWGTDTLISDYAGPRNNSHFDSRIDATTTSAIGPIRYIDISAQEITNVHNQTNNEEGNLAYYLKNGDGDGNGGGYEENINLFSFNYPNKDAVKHSAEKLERYIENLIAYVRANGSDKMKTSFYPSRNDYSINNYKINIVGHSMGGLVARYYIENLGYDNHVDKLITVCTPHWGTGSADASNVWGIEHVLCDHDLDLDSAMYGGARSPSLSCHAIFEENCPKGYALTNELNYTGRSNTKYYAIAGIDYTPNEISDSDFLVESLENIATYHDLSNAIQNAAFKKYGKYLHITTLVTNPDNTVMPITVFLNPKMVGDNIVGFLSQIGWTETLGNSPTKRIPMQKICVNIDTNAGNSLESNFHSKMPHRQCVINKIFDFLEE